MRMLKGFALLASALAFASAHASDGHGAHGSHGHAGHAAPAFGDAAHAPAPEAISVQNCWIRALPSRLPAAGYFRLENSGTTPAVLIGAQAEGFGKVMLHTHETTGGMSRMVHVDKVPVPAGGVLDFAPGGHHVMLEQPTEDLQIGTRRPITLWFEGGHAVTAECDVRPPGATQ